MVSEVIREIRENPEVREEVRRLILTDELLAVPAILARMDERQGRMDERQGRMEDRQGRMEGRLDLMDERQGRTEDRLGRMEDRQDRMEETQRQIVQLLARQGERLNSVEEAQSQMVMLLTAQGERLDRVEETQSQMVMLLAEHGERLARLEETQGRIVDVLDRMEARLDRIETDLGGIKGSVVEARAQRRMLELASAGLGLHSSEVVVGPMLPTGASQQFLEACQQAEASAEQRERLRNTDLIIRARRGTDGASKPVYLAVEVAYRLDDEDINRVSESMAILRGLIPKSAEPDAEVMGAIYGTRISDRLRVMAETRDLNVFDEELPR